MDTKKNSISKSECLYFGRIFRSITNQNLFNQMDVARVMSLVAFYNNLARIIPDGGRVAVVSGSQNEPELLLLKGRYTVDFLNYEDKADLFDLTLDWSGAQWAQYRNAYDLVLCEQVLEHLLNPHRAILNLGLLLKRRGTVHVSVPAINNRHGLPNYYFSGFPPETLKSFAEDAGLVVQIATSWASDKAARMYATCDWAPLAESGPLSFFIQNLIWSGNPASLLKTTKGRIQNFAKYPFQTLFQKNSNNEVISWMFATKE